ncbi:octaprenyl-diphosphate synthase [Geomicrobium sp. JCM 19039]|nr:octaprenyl-diphosphate synthase [Geomicrobium sp. JCM 19039]
MQTEQTIEDMIERHVPPLMNVIHSQIESASCPESIKEAMLYSLNAGGKRIRPLLLIMAAQSYKPVTNSAYKLGAALEMIHTYSLIHDDLPSMDNDDYRRGKPTNHRVYGEALAILAGDALLTESFQLVSDISEDDMHPRDIVHITRRMSESAGIRGMVGGQVADIEGEDRALRLEELEWIHRHKTGALLEFAVEAGGILGGAPEGDIAALKIYAENLGLAFQIKDDILDVEGDAEIIGKPVGSDTDNQKSTYPSLLTLSEAKNKLDAHIQTAADALRTVSCDSSALLSILQYVAKRDR